MQRREGVNGGLALARRHLPTGVEERAWRNDDPRPRRFALTTRVVLLTLRAFSASGIAGEAGAEVCSMKKRSLNVAVASLGSCPNALSGAASISESAVLARIRS